MKTGEINKQIANVAILGEDAYTCCKYCKSEWLTRVIKGSKILDDHIRQDHPINHTIMHAKSDNDLIQILISLPRNSRKDMKLKLKHILKRLNTDNGLIKIIQFCIEQNYKTIARDALLLLNSEVGLHELCGLISDKYFKASINEKIKNIAYVPRPATSIRRENRSDDLDELIRIVLGGKSRINQIIAAEKILKIVGYKKLSNMHNINTRITVKIVLIRNSWKISILEKIATGVTICLAEEAVDRLYKLGNLDSMLTIAKKAYHAKIRKIAYDGFKKLQI